MAAQYPHKGGPGNRLGRHYSHFRRFRLCQALVLLSLDPRKFFKSRPNRRSRASFSGADLAIGWSWDETNTALTFRLHTGVRWHDGKPFPKVIRKDYTVGVNVSETGLDDPDQMFYENYACGSDRNYTG
jgi:hypothetical protein